MSDLGSDWNRPNGDLTANMDLFATDTGKQLTFLQALAERLQSPRGAFWYDTDAGLDLRNYVADDEDPAVAANAINAECRKDERCAKCVTAINVAGDTWTITVTPSTEDGATYELVFTASSTQVSLLSAGPSR